jgi:hypothetical protein
MYKLNRSPSAFKWNVNLIVRKVVADVQNAVSFKGNSDLCVFTQWHQASGNIMLVGRDSVDGTATRYGLNGPGIESRWRRDFPHPSGAALGPIQTPI